MIREIFVSSICATLVLSMSTTPAPKSTTVHQTHEPLERELFIFRYEPHFHNMLVVTNIDNVQSCYIFKMTDAEKASIHTDAGLRAVELRLLSTMRFVSFTEVTKDQLHGPTARSCHAVKHYFIEN